MNEYKKSIMEYEDVQDACVAAKEDGFEEGKAEGKDSTSSMSVIVLALCNQKTKPLATKCPWNNYILPHPIHFVHCLFYAYSDEGQ